MENKVLINAFIAQKIKEMMVTLEKDPMTNILGIKLSKTDAEKIKTIIQWELNKLFSNYAQEAKSLGYTVKKGKLTVINDLDSYPLWNEIFTKCTNNNSKECQNEAIEFLQNNFSILMTQQAFAKLQKCKMVIDYCKTVLTEAQQLDAKIKFKD